ncbi:MAG: hypothetical protein IT445_19090 [Phycisphaeraceae bacterium]|nr:hypothetical protein [Phycisphaeraceae bacterium]
MSRKAMMGLRTVRFDLLAAAVGSLWMMLWLAPAVEPAERINPALVKLGPAWSMLLAVVVAAGLVQGHLWMGHARRGGRPGMAALLAAVAAAMMFGQAGGLLAALVAAGIVMHNVAGRFLPAVGIVTAGLMVSATMAIVNPQLGFGHPIALAMTHVMGCAALLHVYERRRPALGTESGVLIGMGWAFWILLGVSLIGQRRATITVSVEYALMWLWPMSALLAWIVLAAWMVRRRVAAAILRRAATLWLLVYAAGWLLGAGQTSYALVMLGILVLGRVLEGWRARQVREAGVVTDYRSG